MSCLGAFFTDVPREQTGLTEETGWMVGKGSTEMTSQHFKGFSTSIRVEVSHGSRIVSTFEE